MKRRSITPRTKGHARLLAAEFVGTFALVFAGCGAIMVDAKTQALGQVGVALTFGLVIMAMIYAVGHISGAHFNPAPFDLRFELGGKRVRLVHGSPRKVNEYLFEDKPARTFERIAALADCDVLVFGHTHKPWVHEYGGVLFVNCGSVGKLKDGDPRSSFAVLATSGSGVTATIERVAYDAEAVAAEMRAVGLPDELAEKLPRAA